MLPTRPHLAPLALLLLVAPTRARADEGWTLVSKSGAMVIERRAVPGSAMPEARVTAHSPLPAWRFAAALWTDRADSDFVRKSRLSRRVIRQSSDEIVAWERVHSPVVSDREYTVRLRRSGDGRTSPFRLTFEAANGEGPPQQSGTVRIEVMSGSWEVSPAPDGGAELVYRVHSEPGGSVPVWIARGAFLDSAKDLMTDVLRWTAAHS